MHNIKVWHLAAFFLVAVLGSMGLSAIGVSFDGIAIFITAAALVVLFGPPALASLRENYEYAGPKLSWGFFRHGFGLPGDGADGGEERLVLHGAVEDGSATLAVAEDAHLVAEDTLAPSAILEQPGYEGTPVISRVLPEEWGAWGIPLLFIDPFAAYSSLQDALPHGYLAGGRAVLVETGGPRYPGHLIESEKQAWELGQVLLRDRLQVIFQPGSYTTTREAHSSALGRADYAQGARVLLALLAGMADWVRTRAGAGGLIPCVILLADAHALLPQNEAMSLVREGELAREIKGVFLHLLLHGNRLGLNLYLQTPTLVGLDGQALQFVKLWFINAAPPLASLELERIGSVTGLGAELLATMPRMGSLLVDTVQGDYHYLWFRDSRSVHSGRRNAPTWEPAGHTGSLPQAGVLLREAPRSSLTNLLDERDVPGSGSTTWLTTPVFHAPAPQPKLFRREEAGYAAVLYADGLLSLDALLTPPEGYQTLILALSNEPGRGMDLLSQERAERLIATIRRLPSLKRRSYEFFARAVWQDWAEAHPGVGPVRTGMGQIERDPVAGDRCSSRPLPSIELLAGPQRSEQSLPLDLLQRHAALLEQALADYRAYAEVRPEDIRIGPTILRFAIRPTGEPEMVTDQCSGRQVPRVGAGGLVIYKKRTQVAQVLARKDDLALVLQAKKLRMEAPVPGEQFIGVEIPNPHPCLVTLREILESGAYREAAARSKLCFALGKDVAGGARIADLGRMPHLLIAGATGAGKSVLLNVLITCILMQASPDDVQLLLVDPKMVEFTLYANVPHLLAPIMTSPRAVADLLRNAVTIMEGRYHRFAELGVRNLEGYRRLQASQPKMRLAALPSIVLVIDELADVMMIAGKDVEDQLARLAQLSRATGMHLVVATQRPEVKVITGLIKANFPARIAFMVSSAVDSCTILDRGGAEDLLGRGDMLYLPAEQSDPDRIQGAYVSDEESRAVADFWRNRARSAAQNHTASAIDLPEQHAFQTPPQAAPDTPEEGAPRNTPDPLQRQVEVYVRTQPRVSVSLLQRRFNLGYNRAANIMDELVRKGMVGSDEGTNRGRTVLAHLQDGSDPSRPAVTAASNQNEEAQAISKTDLSSQ